jgi:MFS family permease
MFTLKKHDYKLFSKTFIAAAVINFFIMTAYYLLFVIGTPYAVDRYAVSLSLAGLTSGTIVFGIIIGRFIIGGIIDRIGFARVLYCGLLLYCLSMVLCLALDAFPLFLCSRLMSGIGVGCINTMTGVLVPRITPPQHLGLGISYFSVSTLLGLAIGPFLAIALMDVISYSSIFIICLGLGVAAGCLSLSLHLGALTKNSAAPAEQTEQKIRGFFGLRLKDYVELKSLPAALTIMVACVCYASVQSFLAFYARAINQMEAAGLFFLVYAVVSIVSRPFSGKRFDKKGENSVVYPAIILLACSQLVLSAANSFIVLLIAGALMSLSYGNLVSIAQALAIKLAPRERFGQATSTYFILLDIGIGLGPFLLGLLIPFTGYRGMYMITAGIALLALPLYYLLHGKKALAPCNTSN